jgi:transcription-repair coupling factor (superfamily II helicase)
VAYLLVPASKLTPATEKRLRTLEALDRLGAGFVISAHDLDFRGAGDLLGEEQAGHMKLIGLGLYQHLLQRGLAAMRGQAIDDWLPEIRLGLSGRFPEAYVPEAEVRISLYARLERLQSAEEIFAFEDEIEDRFGPPPSAVVRLFQLARLKASCRELGIARLDGGPRAIAVSLRGEPSVAVSRAIEGGRTEIAWRGGRLLYPHGSDDSAAVTEIATRFLEELSRLHDDQQSKSPQSHPNSRQGK